MKEALVLSNQIHNFKIRFSITTKWAIQKSLFGKTSIFAWSIIVLGNNQ